MEMVAWLAGEKHSDNPRCASPVIAALVRAFNDFLADDHARGHYLRPLIPIIIDTAGSPDLEQQRGYHLADYTARVLTPLTLEARGLLLEAAELRSMPPVVDTLSAHAAAARVRAHGELTRAATWLLCRAADGLRPGLWAAAAARTARDTDTPRAWAALRVLVAQLARIRHQHRVRVRQNRSQARKTTEVRGVGSVDPSSRVREPA